MSDHQWYNFDTVKSRIVSHIIDHKTFIIVSFSLVIFLIACGVLAMKLKNYLHYKIETAQQTAQKPTPNDIYYATTAGGLNSSLTSLSASDTGVLGTFNDVENDNTPVVDTPYPVITFAPLPTMAPIPTMAPVYVPSIPSCAGTPTAYNSEVYVGASSTLVNNAVSMSVELLDCHNTLAPVNDDLTVTLSGGDAGARINGNTSPVTIQAQNGKATFSVNSSTAGTDTFIISDTTKSFTVTDIHNHNPSVTFSYNSSGNAACTTAAGVPNSWYSDVYPNPPISTNNGSVTLVVDIRDCNKNLAPVSDTLNISVQSGDTGTQLNGGSLPQNVMTQNGEASFTISSQTSGTVTLAVQDTTGGFTVTDPNNHNPGITFNASSTPAPTETPTPTPADTPTPTPTEAPTPTPTYAPTPNPTPGS